MARITDLKLAYQLLMKAYPYRKLEWQPGAKLAGPLTYKGGAGCSRNDRSVVSGVSAAV